jgi:hypothetical protein
MKIDSTAPDCTFLAPNDGDVVHGTVLASFTVSDNLPGDLKSALLLVDGVPAWTLAPVPQGQYDEALVLTAGPHCIELLVTDACGNQHTCGPVCITVILGPCEGIPLPNLIVGQLHDDPFDGTAKRTFRPEILNIDNVTLRDVLTYNHIQIDDNLIVQAVQVAKTTPVLKCTAFLNGPGSGANTNFATGLRKATSLDLDKSICCVAFGIPPGLPCLGDRALLFSPPCTTYMLQVVYVVRDPNTGRTGEPKTVDKRWVVLHPSRDDISNNIEYFSTVAAGPTQTPKISVDVASALNVALTVTDDLAALTQFEGVVGSLSINFATMLAADSVIGWIGYLIDDDEEPIGCLLVEMANAALWHD